MKYLSLVLVLVFCFSACASKPELIDESIEYLADGTDHDFDSNFEFFDEDFDYLDNERFHISEWETENEIAQENEGAQTITETEQGTDIAAEQERKESLEKSLENLTTPLPQLPELPEVPQVTQSPQERSDLAIAVLSNIRNSNILGRGSLNTEGVMDYIKLRNRNPVINDSAIRRLINTYISEAAAEDVNYDIAIAQMLYWTAFLSNRQRVESNNFGGLSSTREWNGRFPYMMRNDGLTEGVRAHIQHLRGYASSTLKNPSTVNVDPRWNFLERIHGTVRTFDQVYPVWTQDAHRYRLNMNMILDKLYEYSDNRSSR